MFPSPTGFIPVEIRLLHYCGFHPNLKSSLVQRPDSTGVNPVGRLRIAYFPNKLKRFMATVEEDGLAGVPAVTASA